MSLEHLVTISDAQDMGSIQHNLQAQRFRDSFIAEKCDPENTTIVDVGDRIDLHAFRSRYFDQDDLNRCNEEVVQELEVEVPKLIDKVIPDEAILELLKKSRNEGENDLKDASPEEIRQFKENIVQAQFNQEGLAYLAGSLKTTGEEFIEKGFNTYEVVGNNEIFSLFNESMISSDGKIDLKKYFQALNEYKRILNRSGIEAIDDYKLRNIGGLDVVSMPYWQAQFDCTLDSENLEESMVYKKLNELEKKPSAFMAHHRPDDLASDKRGLATYINENYGEGETVLYCHGHLGDNGVTVEKNANGADVIFVNSNNNHDGGTNPYLVAYDTKVEDGKVIAIKKMKMRYKKAA